MINVYGSNKYKEAINLISIKYPPDDGNGSLIVNLLVFNSGEVSGEISELLINENGTYIWENDWYEGQDFVCITAVAPVEELFLDKCIWGFGCK